MSLKLKYLFICSFAYYLYVWTESIEFPNNEQDLIQLLN